MIALPIALARLFPRVGIQPLSLLRYPVGHGPTDPGGRAMSASPNERHALERELADLPQQLARYLPLRLQACMHRPS